jgi:hypothetical protein
MPKQQAREIRLTRRVRIDRRGAEALKMALRRAARELGLPLADLQVRRVEAPGAPRSPVRRPRTPAK